MKEVTTTNQQANETFTFFWQGKSPFSQWYPCTFSVDGVTFNCAEQYMMYGKAKLFGDEKAARKILIAKYPIQQKDLGRKVRNFDQAEWDLRAKNIVYRGNEAKFKQNPDLMNVLLSTKGTTLVEASPYDRIWGIGLDQSHPDAQQRRTWRGKNWLGEILTDLREYILEDLSKRD